MLRRHFLLVLAENQRLKYALLQCKVGLHDHDIFGEPVVPVLLQVVPDDDLVPVLAHHAGVFVIVRGREFQQQVILVLLEDALDGIFPILEKLLVTCRLDVQVMRFVGNQNHLLFAEILERDGVLFFRRQVNVQLLNRGKADADVARIDALKILDRRNPHVPVANDNVRYEQKLRRSRIQEVVFRLLDDVRGIDEEQEITVALLIQVQDQPRHDKRLAAARRHVEHEIQRVRLAGEIVLVAVEEARERLDLVGPQLILGVQVPRHGLRDFPFQKSHPGNGVQLLVKKLLRHCMPRRRMLCSTPYLRG